MRINFIINDGGIPEGKAADVDIYFDEGPLSGLRLTGITIWKGQGEKYPFVTFPSRPYMDGDKRRFYDYLRPAGMDPENAKKFKEHLIKEYKSILQERGEKNG